MQIKRIESYSADEHADHVARCLTWDRRSRKYPNFCTSIPENHAFYQEIGSSGIVLDGPARKLSCGRPPIGAWADGTEESWQARATFCDRASWKAAYRLMRIAAKSSYGAIIPIPEIIPDGLGLIFGDRFNVFDFGGLNQGFSLNWDPS